MKPKHRDEAKRDSALKRRIKVLEYIAKAARSLVKIEAYMDFKELRTIPGVLPDYIKNPRPGNKLAEGLKRLDCLSRRAAKGAKR